MKREFFKELLWVSNKMRDIKEVKFPKKKGSNVYTAIFVPSTNKQQKQVSKEEFKKRVDTTARFLSGFGGYTTHSTHGGWIGKKGKLIREPGAKVESYTKAKEYKGRQQKIKSFLKSRGKKWGQQTMGYVFEEELHFIDSTNKRTLNPKQRRVLRRRIMKVKPWLKKKK